MSERAGDWSEGWIDGFAAATLLFCNRYDDYAERRDEYLARRYGWATTSSARAALTPTEGDQP